MNSAADHVHILLALSRKRDLSYVIQETKRGSSRWIKTKGPAFRDFYWHNGFGAFSVSQSLVPKAKSYIASQERHHRKMTFQTQHPGRWPGLTNHEPFGLKRKPPFDTHAGNRRIKMDDAPAALRAGGFRRGLAWGGRG